MVGPNEKLRVLRRLPEVVFDEEMHGYNKKQVDKVLDRLAPLADEVDTLLERLGEAERRAAAAEARLMEQGGPAPTPAAVAESSPPSAEPVAPADFDETLSKTLLLAQRTADATVKEANDEATRIRTAAEVEVHDLRERAESESERLRAEAEAERASAMSTARVEVDELVETSRAELERKVGEAEAELAEAHEATRAELVGQIADLRESRDVLSADLEQIEGHLAARRETIREALAELSAVIDDPDRLRTTMPPSPVAVEVPADGEFEPISVDVPSIDSLGAGVAPEALAGDSAQDLGEPVWADEESADEPTEAVDAPPATALVLGESDAAVEIADLADDEDGEATEAVPVVDLSDGAGEAETSARPAWADAVPPADPVETAVPSGDPFLDELRRVTNDEADEDQALANFLNEEEEDKGGWFGRRR